MIYRGKQDIKNVKKLFKRAAEDAGFTMTQTAAAAGLSPQDLNNRFLRQDINPAELARILSCIGLQLDIDIIPASDNKIE